MSETKEIVEKTSVKEVDIDINDLLGVTGGDSIITNDKPGFFTSKPMDMSDIVNSNQNEVQPEPVTINTKVTEESDNLDLLNIEDPEDETKKKKFSSKADLVNFTNNLIEKKILIPFDDDKKLEDYTIADFEELYEVNAQEKEKKVREEVPAQFFQSLPEELQYAAKYVADGGKDLKGLFQALAQSRQITEIDITTEEGQESAVRQYLLATNYGSSDEIDEEIQALKDRNELSKKASKFKPKLDNMQNQIIASKLKREETLREQRENQAAAYTDNIYKVLEPGTLNGLKVDRKTQNLLFSGLVQPNYPSVSGKSTNLLGHLLEKYQFVEPNHALVAEALWLLADPEGYKTKVREIQKKDVVAQTVRTLKTEQGSRSNSTEMELNEPVDRKKLGDKLAKPSRNFFSR